MDENGTPKEAKKAVIERLVKLKLANDLQDLAEKVVEEGTDGNLSVGEIQIKGWRVEVRVQLATLTDELVTMLKRLNFEELARAKSVNVLIGTIDVRQLEALAILAPVRRVESVL